MDEIRKAYNVPAKVKGKITFLGVPGIILGAWCGYLRVQFENHAGSHLIFPTDNVVYL